MSIILSLPSSFLSYTCYDDHSTMAQVEKGTGSSLDHLTKDELEERALVDQVTLNSSSAGYFTLFRYSTPWDRAVFITSIAACMAAGAATPMMMARIVFVPSCRFDWLSCSRFLWDHWRESSVMS